MNTKPIRKFITIAAIVMLWLLGPAAGEAQAYIDPGTGSSLLPSLGMMLAVVTAFLAVMFTQFKRIMTWLWIVVMSLKNKKKKRV